MAVTNFVYASLLKLVFTQPAGAPVDWDTDVIKLLLTSSSYSPNQDAHDYANDVTNELAGGGGYATGGETLTAKTNATTNNVMALDAADVAWAAATFTMRRAVLYDSSGAASSQDTLFSWVDAGVDESVVAGTLTFAWHASGIIVCTMADASGFP